MPRNENKKDDKKKRFPRLSSALAKARKALSRKSAKPKATPEEIVSAKDQQMPSQNYEHPAVRKLKSHNNTAPEDTRKQTKEEKKGAGDKTIRFAHADNVTDRDKRFISSDSALDYIRKIQKRVLDQRKALDGLILLSHEVIAPYENDSRDNTPGLIGACAALIRRVDSEWRTVAFRNDATIVALQQFVANLCMQAVFSTLDENELKAITSKDFPTLPSTFITHKHIAEITATTRHYNRFLATLKSLLGNNEREFPLLSTSPTDPFPFPEEMNEISIVILRYQLLLLTATCIKKMCVAATVDPIIAKDIVPKMQTLLERMNAQSVKLEKLQDEWRKNAQDPTLSLIEDQFEEQQAKVQMMARELSKHLKTITLATPKQVVKGSKWQDIDIDPETGELVTQNTKGKSAPRPSSS